MFTSRPVGGKFDDPVVLVRHDAQRILCDCGRMEDLSEMARVSTILISHTHLDHFCGFDDVFRQQFGTGKTIHVYGPARITEQVRNRLSSYTWNVADPDSLHLVVNEIAHGTVTTSRFTVPQECQGRLIETREIQDGLVYSCDDYYIRCRELDHHIPSLAYRIAEHDGFNVDKTLLRKGGFLSGPWLEDLKTYAAGDASRRLIKVNGKEYDCEDLLYLLIPKEGDSVAYMVDFTVEKDYDDIVEFARGARILYCESYFSDNDRDLALAHRHLTAGDAGLLALRAGVGELVLMHFSNRYKGREDELVSQARTSFPGAR